jgi:hypothetical protein
MTESEVVMKIYEHTSVMNAEQGRQAVELARLCVRLDFIEKLMWAIIIPSIGGAVASVWSLVLHRRNGKK